MCRYQPMKQRTRVSVQPHAFGVLEFLFNTPSGSNGLDHLWQGGSFWGKNKVICFLMRISEAPPNEYPMVPIIFPLMQQEYASPVKKSRTRAFLHSSKGAANRGREP